MTSRYLVYIAWIQSILATLGSLYFSEVRHFAPCQLCWYQRIFLYPLVIIIAVSMLRQDKKLYQYVLPLSVIGLLIALYQVLLQYGIIAEGLAPCAAGVSCTVKYVDYLGFITIPLMSFTTFAIITICMLLVRMYQNKK